MHLFELYSIEIAMISNSNVESIYKMWSMFIHLRFYRAMHFSAKRGIMSSVCLSLCL